MSLLSAIYDLPMTAGRTVVDGEAAVEGDLRDQLQGIESGILLLPVEMARTSVRRWGKRLGGFGEPNLDRVATSLGELAQALEEPLDRERISPALMQVGYDVRYVAAERLGLLGALLDRLADSLISAGRALRGDVH